ncbi:PREDICTED: molybdopterin synthase catalytic subunit [Papilio xuthus]|uniref:Molybdopterin synthase catalytic subunit n=1 Tax=Papilio xuthus TaxID=66420 RepID=A0AAJ7EBS9_PAPXU|nr:PREDICTED: molybdopterin synthase catalytic subunit [Papilio xuthus]
MVKVVDMDHLKLTEDKLSVEAISELVGDSSCGAISVFIGTTRDNFEGKKVVKLEYEAYEAMALKAFKDICNEIRSKWPAVHGIAIYHRVGEVECREASLVVAVSSAHRGPALAATAHCVDSLKASAPVWKREHYAGEHAPVWKENPECSPPLPHRSPCPSPPRPPDNTTDRNLIQINVSNEELQQRIQNFIERKRAQVDATNIVDFIPGHCDSETQDADTCARVRTQFVKRSDSKGHLKIRKVHNEWGPQLSRGGCGAGREVGGAGREEGGALPGGVAERLRAAEEYLSVTPVGSDVYRRLKQVEDRIAQLQAISPEYAHFWKCKSEAAEASPEAAECAFSAEDIARKIDQLEQLERRPPTSSPT